MRGNPLALRPQARLCGAADVVVGRDHLRDDEPGPETPGDAPERDVGHPGQRRQDGPAVEAHVPDRDPAAA